MATYNGNYLNMLNGHMNLYDNSGNPTVPKVDSSMTGDSVANVRQAMTNLVGRGYKDLTDKDARDNYASLVSEVGVAKARKMAEQAIIFNQRSDVRNMSIETKVQSFFDMGSSDKDVNELLGKARTFGDGVVAGMNRSPDTGNMKLTNQYDDLPVNPDNPKLIADINKKIP